MAAWTDADLVWNRALSPDPGRGTGDRRLHALHPLHGRVMNAGTAAAEDVCTREQILEAADSFDYLGLTDLAAVIRRLPGSDFSNGREQRMNRAYFGLVQTDSVVWAAFLRKYASAPEDFDPPPTSPPIVGRPEVPVLTEPRELVTCDGLLTVHELKTTCPNDAVCRWTQRPVVHAFAALHPGVDCELCPEGPDWAL